MNDPSAANGAFGDSYRQALADGALGPEAPSVYALAQEIERVLRMRTAPGTAIQQAAGVEHVLSAGSALHGTYVRHPPDFDALVAGTTPQDQINRKVIPEFIEHFSADLLASPVLEAYTRAMGWGAPRGIVLRSLAPDGPITLLARFDLAVLDGTVEWLDLSFGWLFRAIGLELRRRAFSNSLAPLARDRWHAEIRLGKRMFDAIGGLYHSWEHGMRAHTIEHWVTRSPGPARLHNLLLETNASAHRTFRQFRDQSPVWHPGVSHAVAAGRGYEPFNLLDYLGDGDDALAESKWRRLCAAAAEYCRRFAQDAGWKLEDFRIAEA